MNPRSRALRLFAAIALLLILAPTITRTAFAEADEAKEPKEQPPPPNATVPDEVLKYLQGKFEGFEPVGKEDYEQDWFKEGMPDFIRWAIKADFDGNGKDDYALLLKNKKEDKVILVTVRTIRKGFAHDVLDDNMGTLPVTVRLDLKGPGPTSIDLADAENPKTKNLKWPALFSGALEADSSDTLHYWERGRWHEAYVGL